MKSCLLLTIATLAVAWSYTRAMTPKELEEVQLESKSCNKQINMGKSKCLSTTNCCYFLRYEPFVENYIPTCTGINVFKKFYAKNETEYLAKTNNAEKYNSITMQHFCEIIKGDEYVGSVRDCGCFANNIQLSYFLLMTLAFISIL